eukprot:66275-Alexandrium_andersonii.AAC.1
MATRALRLGWPQSHAKPCLRLDRSGVFVHAQRSPARKTGAEAPTAGALALPQHRALALGRPPHDLISGRHGRLRN